jgi:hypothetical protein
MKFSIFFFLLFPLCVSAQTVHVDDKEIEYKNEVKVKGLTTAEIFSRAKQAVESLVNKTGDLKIDEDEKELKVDGVMRLSTPYPIIRKVNYELKISAKENGYEYKIDEVSLYERHRGYDAHTISSKDLLDQMEESGKPAIEAEKILNAIDLNLQKLLTLLHNRITE